LHFKNVTANVPAVSLKKALDVVPINRRAAVEAPMIAERVGSTKRPQPCWTRQAMKPLRQSLPVLRK
jgi:hypothetical protein